LAYVREKRPGSVETSRQEAAVFEYARHLKKRKERKERKAREAKAYTVDR